MPKDQGQFDFLCHDPFKTPKAIIRIFQIAMCSEWLLGYFFLTQDKRAHLQELYPLQNYIYAVHKYTYFCLIIFLLY